MLGSTERRPDGARLITMKTMKPGQVGESTADLPVVKSPKRALNVVQEVGRDPLRVPANTPPDQTIETARELARARRRLEKVLPQPRKR